MRESKRGRWLKWLSLPIFFLVLIAAYVNYTLIDRAEDVYVGNTTSHVAKVVQSEIQRVIGLPLLVLDQMGREWIRNDGFGYTDWEFRAQNFIRLFSSVQSIEWINQSHTIRWIVPYAPNRALIGTNLNKFPGTVHVINQVQKTNSLILTPVITLIEGGTGFLMMKGVYDQKNKSSVIAAVFESDKLFRFLLRQSLFQGFSFTIKQNNQILYSRGEPINQASEAFIKTLTIPIKNVNWLLTVWPSQQAMATMKSSAPQNILVSGVFIAFILAALFYIAGQKIQLGENSIRTAREIAEATKKNHLILEKANEGFVSVDKYGKILNWNLYAEKIFGWVKEEVLGKRFQDFVVPEADKDNVIQRIKSHIDSKQSDALDKKIEMTAVNKAGFELPVEMMIFTIRSEDQNTYHAFVRDITERKLVEKMKNEFISVVSHELRTPLTAIKGSISLLVDNVRSDLSEKSKKLLSIAQKNCDRLILLINDILDLEKIESGKFELRNKRFKIMSLLEEAVRMNETYANKYKVKLDIRSGCDVTVFADYDKLMQVLTNLISNAVKFSKPDSAVTLDVRLDNKNVLLSVQDTGEGIPKDFHHKVFGKFAQADSSSAREKSGTGLGLSICKAIVEMHHGQIEFKSAEGEGTTFYVTLPDVVVEDLVTEEFKAEEITNAYNQKKVHILHVEDDPDVLKITQLLLDPVAVVSAAKSLAQAKTMVNTNDYDLVILDFALPDGHGASLLPIMNVKTKQLTPVIVFSAYELGEQLGEHVRAGLIKSLTSNALLLNTVKNILEQQSVLSGKEYHEKA